MKPTKSVLNGKNINLTGDNTIITSNNFNVDKDGNMSCKNANVSGIVNASSGTFNGSIRSKDAIITGGKIQVKGGVGNTDLFRVEDDNGYFLTYIQPSGAGFVVKDEAYRIDVSVVRGESMIDIMGDGTHTLITQDEVSAYKFTQISLEKYKKNFEKLQDNALNILKTIDIYKYNLKNEQDTDKKHIGFVIGDNFNYSKEVTSLDNQGVDNYSFTSLCCKAIQELSTKVEELQKEIKELKEKEEK